MSPYDLAKTECANFVAGECILHLDGRCRVGQRKRCDYYEKSVLGLAKYGDPDVMEAVDEYRTKHKLYEFTKEERAEDLRLCPNCGTVLIARQRYCRACARKRRREGNSRRARARRTQLTSPTPLKSAEFGHVQGSLDLGQVRTPEARK